MKKVDRPELNYIFTSRGDWQPYEFISLPPNVHQTVAKHLQRNPILALSSCWKLGFHHSGLTPFTVHYLLKEEMPVDEWTEKHLAHKYWPLKLTFCYATNLPVISTYVQRSWDQNNFICMRSKSLVQAENRAYGKDLKVKIESRLKELHNQLSIDKAVGLVDDEYMRKFGGHPIPKHAWQHLKGVAGIYL